MHPLPISSKSYFIEISDPSMSLLFFAPCDLYFSFRTPPDPSISPRDTLVPSLYLSLFPPAPWFLQSGWPPTIFLFMVPPLATLPPPYISTNPSFIAMFKPPPYLLFYAPQYPYFYFSPPSNNFPEDRYTLVTPSASFTLPLAPLFSKIGWSPNIFPFVRYPLAPLYPHPISLNIPFLDISKPFPYIMFLILILNSFLFGLLMIILL